MKKKLGIVALLFLSSLAQAGKFSLDTAHTTVEFTVKHLMFSNVTGRFNKYDGTFVFDEKSGKLSDVEVTIEPGSIDTNQAKRDAHLKSPDFFDVDKFSTIKFKGTHVDYKNKKPTSVTGDLTLHGMTKSVKLAVDFKKLVKNPMSGAPTVIFALNGKIDRKDFGLNWNKALETGGVLVGEEVLISVNGEAAEQAK